MKLDLNLVEETAKDLYIRALKILPPDIKQGISDLDERETNPLAKKLLGTMIRNIAVAEGTDNLTCQDTMAPIDWAETVSPIRPCSEGSPARPWRAGCSMTLGYATLTKEQSSKVFWFMKRPLRRRSATWKLSASRSTKPCGTVSAYFAQVKGCNAPKQPLLDLTPSSTAWASQTAIVRSIFRGTIG
jgi:hypothetical protein